MGQGPRAPDVLSVGYEGRTAEEVVDLVAAAGADVLVDVRLTPRSRKPGLSSRRLAAALAERGVEYRHLPGLGNPRPNRAAFHRADPAAGRAAYLDHLLAAGAADLDELRALLPGRRVALLCVERDAAHCHRACITEQLLAVDPGLAVVVL
jgi:uncharacterized protein (DUF488 family)